MNNQESKPPFDKIKEDVLKKIIAGEVKMRPRIYFTAKVGIVFFVAFLSFVASSLLISFIIFSLRASGKLFLLGFGATGLWLFIRFFPWVLLFIVVLLFVLLEWLLKRFRFGYRRSFSKLILLIVLVSILFALMMTSASLHEKVLEQARHKRLPIVVGEVYEDSGKTLPDNGLFRGQVTAVRDNIFIIHEEDEPWEQGHIIFAPPNIALSSFIQVGDLVFVAARLSGGELHAVGIKRLGRVGTSSEEHSD